MVDLDRRDFLKLFGLAGTSAALGGCSESARTLIPYIIPPEDIVPGDADYYATVCRECPAGCGVLAKNRDGRAIKLEGNPSHPVSGGRLCPRGQSALHGLYNPDRIKGPMVRNQHGKLESTSWEQAEELLVRKLTEVSKKGRPGSIVFMTDLTNGTMNDLIGLWLTELGQPGGHVIYEPLAYEPLKTANRIVFGFDGIPSYRIDRADFLISFNAGFLETWISNVEYARKFAGFHEIRPDGRNPFVFVGPRLSMTANNADRWIQVYPGGEYLVALGILRAILDEDLAGTLTLDQRTDYSVLTEAWPVEKIVAATGVGEDTIRAVARSFAAARRPLALAEGLSLTVPESTKTAVAANLLCALNPGTMETLDFSRPTAYGKAAGAVAIRDLSERMRRGEVEVFLCDRANPVFSLPGAWEFRRSLEAVPFVVSFSSAVDETAASAHLIAPTLTPLESWGDYAPYTGATGLMQPVMGPVPGFSAKHLGDILISSGKKIAGPERFPFKDFYEVLQNSWSDLWQKNAPDRPFDEFWQQAVQRGGYWAPASAAAAVTPKRPDFSFPGDNSSGKPRQGYHFTCYPTVQFYDGRQANRFWIQELPDPMTQVTWGGWIELHPDTAKELNVETGDVLRVKSPYGSVEVPALAIYTVPRGTVAMPVGQGHTRFGRFADKLPANPMHLFPPDIDGSSGGILRPEFGVTLEKTGRKDPVAHTDGSFFDFDRGLAELITLSDYKQAVAEGRKPEIVYPLPEGYDPRRDFYPEHVHSDYRWSMVVDLDRCIGCGACVVACYAENNVAVVGKKQVLNSRLMAWLRIQRYFVPDKPQAKWLPLFCQHCDCAPCESVCPVYAPHHGKEGMNNQVYNRCIGTRFCFQNDPYKVRRFNWFTYTRPRPLEWQLNPDVTVRQKGVMEKCSFCVQRVIKAKMVATNEGRKVRDGEFTTACAQTCPTNAFTFGNLLDPDSRVSRLVKDARAYQVFAELNTKPAVIYLKRVTQVLEV